MLDVHAGDVVGQQHDFVAVEFVGVFVRQGGALDLLHDAGDEVAGAGERVKDVHALVGEAFSELLLQDFFDGADHEIDDGLRRVDDAHGVGLLGVEALEELFVDGVEKCCFSV